MWNERHSLWLAVCVFGLMLNGGARSIAAETEQVIEIAPVWSGHPVGFALLTHGERQYVAFYDANRRMTVGGRTLDAPSFQLVRLPETIGWDSHNYITMTVDDEGLLHLSGNMHCVPLVYFRTRKPHDITTFERVPAMVGRDEDRCTYPKFLRGAAGELIFTYRQGGSGNGDQIFNVYDPPTRTWRRLLDRPLFSGLGKMNAYFVGPAQDAQGVFHVCWVWRDTPDCATNHDLSYARSRDLVHWETSDGKPLRLPITIENGEIVDPVPPGGGMINGNTKIGFDAKGRPVLSYHKHDENGHTQVYNARREDGGWRIQRASDWDYRWAFSGGGSIDFEIRVSPVRAEADGTLSQNVSHAKYGSVTWKLDADTLKRVADPGQEPVQARAGAKKAAVKPATNNKAPSAPGMISRTASDSGHSSEKGVRYVLRWQTLGPNRDRPREGEPPPPSTLRLYRSHFGQSTDAAHGTSGPPAQSTK